MIRTTDSNCCGCMECMQICPVNAITLVRDEKGFLYPRIDKTICIDCGKCEKFCSFKKEYSINNNVLPVQSYIARAKSNDILMNSASGGLFTILSDVCLKNNGCVYGAAFDENFQVKHIRANSIEERNRMRGSKYVQSEIYHCFNDIKKDLEDNRQVVFCGTPCQCAAVNSYLQSTSPKLAGKIILVDIICHGVTSPIVWNSYLEYIKSTLGNEAIRSINFRDKNYGDGYNMSIKTDTRTYHKPDIEDPYMYIFGKNYAMRPSCNVCPHKKLDRNSDLTIGDFQKADRFFPEYKDGKGVSVVLINSIDGLKLFNQVKNRLDYEVCTIEQAKQVNLYGEIAQSKLHEKFFEDYHSKPFKKVLKKYTEVGLIRHGYGVFRRFVRDKLYKCKNT